MSTTFTAHDVDIGGLKIHYFKKAGGDLNLVLLHPSSGYGRMWELTAEHLDPRFTVTASKADEWYPIRPGTDLAFILAMLNVIVIIASAL